MDSLDILNYLCYHGEMKKVSNQVMPNEIPLTTVEFLESYNSNMPDNYPRASLALLEKFKQTHLKLFKVDGYWTLNQHRKRIIEWLPQNI